MFTKKFIIIFVVIAVLSLGILGTLGYIGFTKKEQVQIALSHVIGSGADKSGCSINTGTKYDAAIGACVKTFGLSADNEKIAKIAIDSVKGQLASNGNVVTKVETGPTPNTYFVYIDTRVDSTLIKVTITDGKYVRSEDVARQ